MNASFGKRWLLKMNISLIINSERGTNRNANAVSRQQMKKIAMKETVAIFASIRQGGLFALKRYPGIHVITPDHTVNPRGIHTRSDRILEAILTSTADSGVRRAPYQTNIRITAYIQSSMPAIAEKNIPV